MKPKPTITNLVRIHFASFALILFVFVSTQLNAQPHCNAHFVFTPGDTINSVFFFPSPNSGTATYLWTFGDGDSSTLAFNRHIYASPGTYYVCLTVTDSTNSGSCSETECDSVHVLAPPPPVCNAHFTFIQDSINKIQFANAFNAAGSQYSWTFGDGNTSTSTNPSNVYASPGTYYVCLTVTDSTAFGICSDTQCDSVQVLPPPPPVCNAHFNFFADSVNSITFIPSFNPNGAQYSWTFGDGNTSTLPNPRHIYASTGTYYVCLTVTDSTSSGTCSDTQCDSVHVINPPPPTCNAHFTFNRGNPHNALTVMFHPAFNPAGTHYSWNFGDGNTSTSANTNHAYASPGTYYVCLTVTDSTNFGTCTDTQCDSVHVGFIIHGQSFHCNAHFIRHQGDSLKVSFSHAINPSNATYVWDFGDGNTSTLANPTHQYASPGMYNVCCTVTRPNPDSCSATFCSMVNVVGHGHNNHRMDGMVDEQPSIDIFPNPMSAATGAIVSVTNISNPVIFKMYDMTGRLIFTKSNVIEGNFTIAGNNIRPGLYFYLVNDDNDVISSGRLIVQ